MTRVTIHQNNSIPTRLAGCGPQATNLDNLDSVHDPARPLIFCFMANSKSAAKRARQTPRRTLRNRSIMSRLRSLAKGSATNGKAEDHRALISALDKAAKRGVIHRNMANRRKARLNKAAAKTASPAS